TRDEDTTRTALAAEDDRFELWAVNLGLFAPGHASLDYRVREADNVKSMLYRCLTSLNSSLTEAVMDHMSTKVPLGVDPSEAETDDPTIDAADDDWGEDFFLDSESDMDLLLLGIKNSIDRLYKLSIWIRGASSRYASSKALKHRHIDPDTNVDLLTTFEPIDLDYVQSQITHTASVTTATLLQVTHDSEVRPEQSAATVSQYAPSNWEAKSEPIAFPPAPKISPSQKFFECPYCFTICPASMSSEAGWKAHLIHDLRPYLCTYKDCRNPHQIYESQRDWIQHENSEHRQTYCCLQHEEVKFATTEEYQSHMRNVHAENPAHPATLTNQSILISPDRDCPVCSSTFGTLKSLQSHIARHLERISLFTLPRDVSEEAKDDDLSGSNQANIHLGSSRDEDFTDEPSASLDDGSSENDTSNGNDSGDHLNKIEEESPLDVDVDLEDERGETALSKAAKKGHTTIVQRLLDTRVVDANHQDKDGFTPLIAASGWGHIETVETLLSSGKVDVNVQDHEGYAALSRAVSGKHAGVVEALLKAKTIDLNNQTTDGWSALMEAIITGQVTIVELLLDTGKMGV
ncbi:hypothetical protein BCR34DRAFT_441471, partial [Clohesyomyces aquaticus]